MAYVDMLYSGWDHGVFVPMLLINPAADVPIVQLSTLYSQDPADHIKMGRAISKLRDSNVAILGSGFASLHNRQALLTMMSGRASAGGLSSRVDEWNTALTDALAEEQIEKREEKLVQWRKFPNSYEMHPRNGADHLMPLFVCAGAGDGKVQSYKDRFHDANILSFYWE